MHVRVFRKSPAGGPPTPLGAVDVTLPRGCAETSDAARQVAREAAARHGCAVPARVIVNHAVGGGFVAYLPAVVPA